MQSKGRASVSGKDDGTRTLDGGHGRRTETYASLPDLETHSSPRNFPSRKIDALPDPPTSIPLPQRMHEDGPADRILRSILDRSDLKDIPIRIREPEQVEGRVFGHCEGRDLAWVLECELTESMVEDFRVVRVFSRDCG